MDISGTLRAKQLLDDCCRRDEPVLNGGLGESPVGPPLIVRRAVQHALSDTFTYTSCHGNEQMQELLHTDRIVTGNALKELLCILQMAFMTNHPEGVIVLLVPHWPTYMDQARLFKIPVHLVRPSDTKTYKIRPEDILHDEVLLSRKHMVIFNNPCNPSGSVYTDDELKALAMAFGHLNSVVVSDNIYAELAFHGRTQSIGRFHDKVVDATSLSKVFGCGGWRYGWAVFPPTLDKLFHTTKVFASHMYTCPSACFAVAAQMMIESSDEVETHVKSVRYMLRETFYMVIKPMLLCTKIAFTPCEAAWYTLLDFSAYQPQLAMLGVKTSRQLAQLLFEKKRIIMVEGTEFGFEAHELILRYSFVDFKTQVLEDHTISYDCEKIMEMCRALQEIFCSSKCT